MQLYCALSSNRIHEHYDIQQFNDLYNMQNAGKSSANADGFLWTNVNAGCPPGFGNTTAAGNSDAQQPWWAASCKPCPGGSFSIGGSITDAVCQKCDRGFISLPSSAGCTSERPKQLLVVWFFTLHYIQSSWVRAYPLLTYDNTTPCDGSSAAAVLGIHAVETCLSAMANLGLTAELSRYGPSLAT